MTGFGIMYRLEALNFTETEVLWNEFPLTLHQLILKVCVYMGILCLFLSGMQNIRYTFDDSQNAPDKFTAGYDLNVVLTFFVNS